MPDTTAKPGAAPPVTHEQIPANGIELHVATAGPADGPPVVLCHGFPELWYSWRHQLGPLAGAGYRVLAPDLHLDADQLVLTVYVTPRQGYVGGARNPETPIRVELPEPLGLRRLIDGALAELYPQK